MMVEFLCMDIWGNTTVKTFFFALVGQQTGDCITFLCWTTPNKIPNTQAGEWVVAKKTQKTHLSKF